MELRLTLDQILSLAPDEASVKSGRDLSRSGNWSNMGFDDKAVWGECKGSGKNPYRTQVDKQNIAFKCTCPSRKFPCKHGLGLLLLNHEQSSAFSPAEAPDWVREWINKREEKTVKSEQGEKKPVDEEGRAKRQEQRLKKVNGGIEELLLLLRDIVRNGILNMPEKGPDLFRNLTRRMIDAQAQGLAGMARELSEMNYFSDGWQSVFMDRLLRLYLVAQSFGKMEKLPHLMAREIMNLVGFTQATEDLKQEKGIQDHWLVLGKETEQLEQVFVQRHWLYGQTTGRYALVLQFYVRAQLPELNLLPGSVIDADLVFYGGVLPYRAIIKDYTQLEKTKSSTGFKNWNDLLTFEKEQYIISPFISGIPLLIDSVCLGRNGHSWCLNDRDNKSIPIRCREESVYLLLSVSGGKSFSAVLVSRDGFYDTLGVFTENQYVAL